MQVEEDIRNGMAFSDAAGKHPKVFPLLFVNMMRAGEATGNVDDTLIPCARSFSMATFLFGASIMPFLGAPVLVRPL